MQGSAGKASPAKKHRQPRSKARLEKIYEELRQAISMLDYPPNTRLSEQDLAVRFRVSRTPIRHVLTRLEAEGLVESRHGVGTFVTDVNFDKLLEVFQLRMQLAGLIGKLNPLARQEKDLRQIRALLIQFDSEERNPSLKGFARLNLAFFQEVSKMIGNSQLRDIAERLFYLTTRIWLTTMPIERLGEEFVIFRREVTDILTAMEIGDLEAVGFISRSHLSMAFTRLKAYATEKTK